MNVSVALCTHNGAAFLPAQLDSLAAQTRPPDELVVCDDRSSDGTVGLVRSFATRAPFPVRLSVNATALGSTANFEQAIRLCRGDVIALCDQDDFWFPDKIARTEAAFASGPGVGLVAGDAVLADSELTPTPHRLWENIPFTPAMRRDCERGRATDVLVRYNVVTGATAAFRADLRPLVLPIPRTWVHDAWIAFIAAAVADCRFLPEPLILYRRHTGQQIGMAPRTLRRQLRSAAAADRDYLRGHAEGFAVLAGRLSDIRDRLRDPEVIGSLEGKVRHLRLRVRLREVHRFARIPLALRELITGGYTRFGRGLRAFAGDLLF